MPDAADSAQSATERTTSSDAKEGAPGSRGGTATVVAPTLDDETTAALTLYNTYLVADREQQAHERALKKAERAKDDAAATVRKLHDRNAPAAETTEAEASYREAAEAFRRLHGGNTADAVENPPESDTPAEEPKQE